MKVADFLRADGRNAAVSPTLIGDGDICDIWLFKQDFCLQEIVLQENETIDAKYARISEIRQMINNSEFIPFPYINEIFDQ